ncbi:hypothetical protein H7X46_11405 [Pseudonocardia sp. C8]|uniref:hypothetical protein n=1 Tax=Pseudonocardia sp. C8 TaxID=2762759 RepID=UPI0016432D67|nr:hypothetical protein [Pseudonocardia sp. C8]MBC3191667.1 hypothetical protein [Pseudonocardia sp. C8]
MIWLVVVVGLGIVVFGPVAVLGFAGDAAWWWLGIVGPVVSALVLAAAVCGTLAMLVFTERDRPGIVWTEIVVGRSRARTSPADRAEINAYLARIRDEAA